MYTYGSKYKRYKCLPSAVPSHRFAPGRGQCYCPRDAPCIHDEMLMHLFFLLLFLFISFASSLSLLMKMVTYPTHHPLHILGTVLCWCTWGCHLFNSSRYLCPTAPAFVWPVRQQPGIRAVSSLWRLLMMPQRITCSCMTVFAREMPGRRNAGSKCSAL